MQNSTLGIAIVTLSFSVNGCLDRSLLTFPFLYSYVMGLVAARGVLPVGPYCPLLVAACQGGRRV